MEVGVWEGGEGGRKDRERDSSKFEDEKDIGNESGLSELEDASASDETGRKRAQLEIWNVSRAKDTGPRCDGVSADSHSRRPALWIIFVPPRSHPSTLLLEFTLSPFSSPLRFVAA